MALQNQKVLQMSNYRVSGHSVQYEAEFWLSNKRFCKQKKKEEKQFIFVILCV
jgi:hypothetical protein